MAFSAYIANKLLDHIFSVSAYTPPANIYVALYSSNPMSTGLVGELAGGGYARKLHANWNAASGGDITNSGVVTFPAASTNWATVTHVAVFDHISAGNFLGGGALTTPIPVNNGDIVEFASGQLIVGIN